jgi:hypothetical protein
MRASLLIGICCLLIYNINGRAITAGDTYPARYLPFAIVQHHTLALDPIARVTAQGRGDQAYWMIPVPGRHIISLYPVVLPVLVSPLYIPAVAYLNLRGWTDARVDRVARIMEKVCASLIAALSVSLLYILLRRRASTSDAWLLTIAYALGTTTWVISSQALWQHGLAELLIVAILLLVTGPCTLVRTLAVGLLCGLLGGNRPPDILLAGALGAYALFWAGPRRAAILVVSAAAPMGLVLFYNVFTLGNLGGGYGLIDKRGFFSYPLFPGLAGLLFSPTHGLFVFSPFLIFVIVAWRYVARFSPAWWLTMAMSVAIVSQIVMYAKTDWRGGVSWGPRYMTDFLPMVIWMLAPVVGALRGLGRVSFAATAAVSILIQTIGAFYYTGATDAAIFAAGNGPEQMSAAWDWHNTPFLTVPRQGLAPAELLTRIDGDLGILDAAGRPVSAVTEDQPAVVAGRATAGGARPWQVGVLLDGRQWFTTQTFDSRNGWRIPLETAGLAIGDHTVALLAWASDKGEPHYLGQRTLTVRAAAPAGPDEELIVGLKTTAARIRAHQQALGYWHTTYTATTQYQQTGLEMNTYVTSLLVDLLDPLVADAPMLRESVSRARQFLSDQIEGDGLVRYYGRPDGPTIGILGCVITPDTFDTALAWRLAPAADRGRLTAALATLERYRTEDGLYRTWLAPRDAYRCLDPGRDPNPADLTVQMHLFLLLAKTQPPAASALCAALQPVNDQDRVWVYYSLTPLLSILRLPDLEQAGCHLDLPESRLRAQVPGQETWIAIARLLARRSDRATSPAMATEIQALLHDVAKDDFALLRTNPPLLYHNDLTATVPRYYWSEDVGYALWLRLAHAYARAPRR